MLSLHLEAHQSISFNSGQLLTAASLTSYSLSGFKCEYFNSMPQVLSAETENSRTCPSLVKNQPAWTLSFPQGGQCGYNSVGHVPVPWTTASFGHQETASSAAIFSCHSNRGNMVNPVMSEGIGKRAVYGQDPQSGTNNQNANYTSNNVMYVEAMELGVGATETVVTCGDGDIQCVPSTVDLRQLDADPASDDKCESSKPGTSLQPLTNYSDRYEELLSPASVASECSVNSHVAYAEVANENIIKEIETFIARDPHNIPVKQLRGIIPKMKMVTYLEHEEWQGKEKVKFLWENKPEDWPIDVHHSDPNNGIRRPGSSTKIKPKKEDLIPMFEHLRLKYLQMYKPEALISKPMDEDRAEITLKGEPKFAPISMTEVPAEVKMAPSCEPTTPQPVPETGNWHQMTQLQQMVENQYRKLESQLDGKTTYHLQLVYDAVVLMSETVVQPEQQTRYIEGCFEVLKLLFKIECGIMLGNQLEQNCMSLIENYGQKDQMPVKTEIPLETIGSRSYHPEVMVYNVQAPAPPKVTGQVVWDDMETKSPICGSNAMLSSTGPSMKKYKKNALGFIPFSDDKMEDLLKATNIETRVVANPDPEDENVYPLPEKMAKYENMAPVPTQMDQIVQAQRQQSIEPKPNQGNPNMCIKQEKKDMDLQVPKFTMNPEQQQDNLQLSNLTQEDLNSLLEFFQQPEGQNYIQTLQTSTPINPGGVPGPPVGSREYMLMPPGGNFMNPLSDSSSRGSNESLNSFPFNDVLDLETDMMTNPSGILYEQDQNVAVKPPPPKTPELPAVLDDFNQGPDSMEHE